MIRLVEFVKFVVCLKQSWTCNVARSGRFEHRAIFLWTDISGSDSSDIERRWNIRPPIVVGDQWQWGTRFTTTCNVSSSKVVVLKLTFLHLFAAFSKYWAKGFRYHWYAVAVNNANFVYDTVGWVCQVCSLFEAKLNVQCREIRKVRTPQHTFMNKHLRFWLIRHWTPVEYKTIHRCGGPMTMRNEVHNDLQR